MQKILPMRSSQLTKEVRRWLNNGQMKALMCMARILAMQAGRRYGKSEEIGAERTLKPAWVLKGASGFMAARSHSKLLDHLLPGIIAGWNKRGIYEDVDFVIGKTPPKRFKRPILPPVKYDHYISFEWGSGIHMISFDHGSTSNGLTTDFGLVDEAKQIDPVRLDNELLKTMNGHGSTLFSKDSDLRWRDVPEHLMLTILSDAFIGKYDFEWIGRYEAKAISEDELLWICYLVDEVQKSNDPELQHELRKLQRQAIVYLEASTEENLAALGIEYFESQEKHSDNLELRVSIFNEKVLQIKGSYYKFLNEATHTYEARNYSRIDAIGVSDYLKGKQKNCKLDMDWRPELPIKLSVDYGSTHCWFLAAQYYAQTHWMLKNFWTTDQQIEDGVDKFCDYYEPHPKEFRVIELYDDPYGHKKGTNQQRDVDNVIKQFKKRGWKVTHKTPGNFYIPHDTKYRIMEKGLDERKTKRDNRFSKCRINFTNAYETYFSSSKAPLRLGMQGEYQKNKDSEKDLNLPQWKATHLSDCLDMIYCFDNKHLVEEQPGFSF